MTAPLRLGVVGHNEGNGHPYSYSAMFNGYDPRALELECPYALIREYLPANHRNENLISGARVSHVWTQDPTTSAQIARVAKIPEVCDSYEQLVAETDAVLLLRDDPECHWELARVAIEAGKPVYVDKALAACGDDLAHFREAVSEGARLMAGSAFRHSHFVSAAAAELDLPKVQRIHGLVCNTWLRYASHVLDPVGTLFGLDVRSVRNLGPEPGRETVVLEYASGLELVLQCHNGIGLPIHFTCYSPYPALHYRVPLTDFHFMYRSLMAEFVQFVTDGSAHGWEDTLRSSQIVLAGVESLRLGGEAVDPRGL